jgi:hypothetical protein
LSSDKGFRGGEVNVWAAGHWFLLQETQCTELRWPQ